MGVIIRSFGEHDIERVDPLLRAAYAVTFSRSAELRRNLAIQPDGWLLAEQHGTPVGMVGMTNYQSFAYVGLMAVDPQVQRQGIGRLLIDELIARSTQRGYPTLELEATELGAPLYRKVGFIVDGQSAIYNQVQPFSPMVSPGVRRMHRDDIPLLAALDGPIFGADRTRVLARLLHDLPDRAFVVSDPVGQLAGFIFAQAATLGPWVATSPLLAEALFDTALALVPIEQPRALVAGNQPYAESLLLARGFARQRTVAHMRRGPASRAGRPADRYGMTSFALG